ncbi:MAG: hypothetical protein EBR90_01395 [Actinobacteria bacterium]|nr:hypothetical protein [Actinomycetota bacterium]
MASLTLLEMAKQARETGDILKAGIVEQYAGNSPILDVIGFEERAGGVVEWLQEKTLPVMANRAVNENFTASSGEVEKRIEKVVIAGGEIKIDTAGLKLYGPNVLTTQISMSLKSLQLKWHSDFFNGDHAANPKEFSGLKVRAGGTQLVQAGNTSGGDALSLSALRRAIAKVRPVNPRAQVRIYSNLELALRYQDAISNPSISGYVVQTKNDVGVEAPTFKGIPWYAIEEDAEGDQILGFTEQGSGGGASVCSSIYIVAFSPEDLTGIQTGGIDVRDLGEMQTETKRLIRMDWLNNFATYNPRSFARLAGVKDAAFTA